MSYPDKAVEGWISNPSAYGAIGYYINGKEVGATLFQGRIARGWVGTELVYEGISEEAAMSAVEEKTGTTTKGPDSIRSLRAKLLSANVTLVSRTSELAAVKSDRDELRIQLDAWQSVFSTSQLSHAQARLEQSEKDRDEAMAVVRDFFAWYAPKTGKYVRRLTEDELLELAGIANRARELVEKNNAPLRKP